jgi:hypothetical protein
MKLPSVVSVAMLSGRLLKPGAKMSLTLHFSTHRELARNSVTIVIPFHVVMTVVVVLLSVSAGSLLKPGAKMSLTLHFVLSTHRELVQY